jgi:2-aminoadipate transaminase
MTMQSLSQSLAPGMISLMIGYPDPATLTTPEFATAVNHALGSPELALNYGNEQGNPSLINYLATRISSTQHIPVSADQVMITAGSTHANDMIARLYARGGAVIVEGPTYADALHIYRDHGIEIYSVPMDTQGLIVSEFEALLNRLAAPPRLFYTIPNFHNPTGITTVEVRRREILRLAQQYNFMIVEDDVYRELAFDTNVPLSYFALSQGMDVNVMQIGSFSKTLAPGLRLGWIVADKSSTQRFVNCGTTQMGGGASPLSAQIAADYCSSGAWETHVQHLRALYQTRRDTMLTALERCMPAGVTWTIPAGGFFVWLTLPERVHGQEVKREAAARGVLVSAGEGYFIDPVDGMRNLRLAYSSAPLRAIETAVKILGEVIAESA